MQFRAPTKPSATINIAPLVDVVFLLVIFFAVSTTFLESSGLKLELPESSSTASRAREELTVQLGSDGVLAFEGEIVEREQLGSRLSTALAGSESKQVVLRADTGTRHGDVVRVMDIIRLAGSTTITLAARPEAK